MTQSGIDTNCVEPEAGNAAGRFNFWSISGAQAKRAEWSLRREHALRKSV
jgi:hypothetical protein